MIILSIPPVDGLVLTPGLVSFYQEEYSGVYYVMLDIGIKVAQYGGLNNKIKVAHKTYNKLVGLLLDSEYAIGGKALIVIPDDFELSKHIKLATAWLNSYERRTIHKMLNNHGYEPIDVLVIRRYITDRFTLSIDLSPYLPLIRTYANALVYAIPANISTALVNTDIKCRSNPNECITHIKLAVNTLINELEKPWIHLLGPSLKHVLQRFYNNINVTSADITGHTDNLASTAKTITVQLRLRNILTRAHGVTNPPEKFLNPRGETGFR